MSDAPLAPLWMALVVDVDTQNVTVGCFAKTEIEARTILAEQAIKGDCEVFNVTDEEGKLVNRIRDWLVGIGVETDDSTEIIRFLFASLSDKLKEIVLEQESGEWEPKKLKNLG